MDKAYGEQLSKTTYDLLWRFIDFLYSWYGAEIDAEKFISSATCRKIYETLSEIQANPQEKIMSFSGNGDMLFLEPGKKYFSTLEELTREAYNGSCN